MRKKYLILLFFTISFFAQSRKSELQLAPNTSEHELYVAFSQVVSFHDDNFHETLSKYEEILLLIKNYGITFHKGIPLSDEKISDLYDAAKGYGNNGSAVLKLKNILKLELKNSTNEKLLALSHHLEKLDIVEYCNLMPLQPIAPPNDISPATPDYEANQVYLEANPGVNMRYAWGLGLAGSGIRIRDIEYGFNKNHEELTDRNAFIAPGMTIASGANSSYTEHGTSVFGIMYADKGVYGTSGMAYDASEMVLFPEWQQTGYNRVNAVTQAIANSVSGDVIVYEMQAYGENNNFVPAEFNNVVWDLTKAATDAGIIIVEAAANGNQDLDSTYYTSYMARGNSGAIIVGGGTNNLMHNRVSYSTYGSRVDVQGWANNVLACGKGDLLMIGGDFNQGYTNFSGTSSATPMVASCVVVLQSYYHGLTGLYMTGPQMRQLLQQTGVSQGNGVAGNIGPLPDMQAAILQIDQNLSVAENENISFSLFPNPVADYVSILIPNIKEASAQLEIYSALGQKVSEYKVHQGLTTLTIAGLSQGVYFVKVLDGKRTQTKKIIKQ